VDAIEITQISAGIFRAVPGEEALKLGKGITIEDLVIGFPQEEDS
jgi:hypothetical protein